MAGLTASGRDDCYNGTNGGLRGETRWIALFVGDPDSSGTEVSATGYARLQRTAAQMPVSGGKIRIAAGEFEDAAQASWGTPTFWAVYDAATGGNRKYSAPIAPAISEIAVGARVFTNANDLEFEIPLS